MGGRLSVASWNQECEFSIPLHWHYLILLIGFAVKKDGLDVSAWNFALSQTLVLLVLFADSVDWMLPRTWSLLTTTWLTMQVCWHRLLMRLETWWGLMQLGVMKDVRRCSRV